MKYKLTMTYRKEKGTGGPFTSKNRGFFFRVKKKWEKVNLEEEECQVSLGYIRVSRLFWMCRGSKLFFHIWMSLRKMQPKWTLMR